MKRMYALQTQITAVTHDTIGKTKEMKVIIDEVTAHLSDFEDFFRPLRSYFYWEKHCYDIPICWSIRSIFDSLDGLDTLHDKLHDVVQSAVTIDGLTAQLLPLTPKLIAVAEATLK